MDGLLRGDYQSRMTGYATARQNGWMSANDIRELENMDRIPEELGGDLYLINGNMTKLQDAGIFAGSGKGKDTGEEVLELEENGGKPSVNGWTSMLNLQESHVWEIMPNDAMRVKGFVFLVRQKATKDAVQSQAIAFWYYYSHEIVDVIQ